MHFKNLLAFKFLVNSFSKFRYIQDLEHLSSLPGLVLSEFSLSPGKASATGRSHDVTDNTAGPTKRTKSQFTQIHGDLLIKTNHGQKIWTFELAHKASMTQQLARNRGRFYDTERIIKEVL